MKKLICIIALFCAVTVQTNAQDWKSILSGVAKAVVGDKATTQSSLIGTWSYVGPDCQFESDNILTQAGGEVAASKVDKKKIEVKEIVHIIKGKTINGTYTFDPEAKTVTIKGRLGMRTTAHIVTLGNNMSFVFNADKIMSVLKTITGAASKVNSTASTINSIAKQFDGMMVGFELEKQQ